MNYIKQLSAFYELADKDDRLSPYHFCLYVSLFRCWNLNFFQNPVSIARDEMMKMAKIGSVNTYIRCMRELNNWNYIRYQPSRNRYKGSLVHMFTFDNTSETEVIPSINNINYTNNTNLREQAQKNDFKILGMNTKIEEKEKLREKKKIENENRPSENFPPSMDHVKIYFDEKGIAAIEAEKFYNYFESNGWLVGGRAKMKDWKAAARNWILNIPKFEPRQLQNQNRATKLSTSKNYNEPL